MAKLPTSWIDNKNPVSISASDGGTVYTEASVSLCTEASSDLLVEDLIVTAKEATVWS